MRVGGDLALAEVMVREGTWRASAATSSGGTPIVTHAVIHVYWGMQRDRSSWSCTARLGQRLAGRRSSAPSLSAEKELREKDEARSIPDAVCRTYAPPCSTPRRAASSNTTPSADTT